MSTAKLNKTGSSVEFDQDQVGKIKKTGEAYLNKIKDQSKKSTEVKRITQYLKSLENNKVPADTNIKSLSGPLLELHLKYIKPVLPKQD
jgi:hypothetical protein